MANFQPYNNYFIYLLDQAIDRYHLSSPFLDAGCGSGYFSKHLLQKGWRGKAIDFSNQAVKITKNNLQDFKDFKVEKKNVLKEKGKFKTILMVDVIEHIKDDDQVLKKAYSLLEKGGYLVIGTPSNPPEWRWDDDFYGHFRRYTRNDLKNKLTKAKLKPVVFWDYTFPFFWVLRRAYTKFKKPLKIVSSKEISTKQSSFSNAWDIPIISQILDKTTFLWIPLFLIQFTFFRKFINQGNAIFVIAQRV